MRIRMRSSDAHIAMARGWADWRIDGVERNTKQKELIHDALKASSEFISAQNLHRRLEDEGVKVGLATVYRQLNALADAGEADTISHKYGFTIERHTLEVFGLCPECQKKAALGEESASRSI